MEHEKHQDTDSPRKNPVDEIGDGPFSENRGRVFLLKLSASVRFATRVRACGAIGLRRFKASVCALLHSSTDDAFPRSDANESIQLLARETNACIVKDLTLHSMPVQLKAKSTDASIVRRRPNSESHADRWA